jgi:hypothetical protein
MGGWKDSLEIASGEGEDDEIIDKKLKKMALASLGFGI